MRAGVVLIILVILALATEGEAAPKKKNVPAAPAAAPGKTKTWTGIGNWLGGGRNNTASKSLPNTAPKSLPQRIQDANTKFKANDGGKFNTDDYPNYKELCDELGEKIMDSLGLNEYADYKAGLELLRDTILKKIKTAPGWQGFKPDFIENGTPGRGLLKTYGYTLWDLVAIDYIMSYGQAENPGALLGLDLEEEPAEPDLEKMLAALESSVSNLVV